MSSVSQYFKGLFGGIGALITGMMVTLKALFSKKITQQYPENRKTLVISDRFRGELNMPHDENNEHACTSCGICEMNCPNGTIKITSKTIETEDGKKKKILDTYHYNLGMCTFCNLCVITCPSNAIMFDNIFENAIFSREKLNMKLNKEGSKLKEKKKPAAAPKPTVTETATVENLAEPAQNIEKTQDNKPSAENKEPEIVPTRKSTEEVKPQVATAEVKEEEAKVVEKLEIAEKPVNKEPEGDKEAPTKKVEERAEKPTVQTSLQEDEKKTTEKPPIKDIIDKKGDSPNTNNKDKDGDKGDKPKPPRINRI